MTCLTRQFDLSVNVTAVADIHYLSFFTARLSGTARDPLEGFEGLSGSTFFGRALRRRRMGVWRKVAKIVHRIWW
jgi:hypothetical protein